jgi:hypothetical protein
MTENLVLALLCVALFISLYKVRGILFFMAAMLVFSSFAIFGSFFFISSFVVFASELLSNSATPDRNVALMRAFYHVAGFVILALSARVVFNLVTSEDLNSYLGTEAIFPIRKRKAAEVEEVPEEKKRPPIERWS